LSKSKIKTAVDSKNALEYFSILHDPLYYRVNPDILSPVGDPLPGNGCGSPNDTCI